LIDKILSGELTFKLYNFEQRGEAPTELFSSCINKESTTSKRLYKYMGCVT